MLNGFLILLLCQLVGEVLVLASGIPVPGPVMGMVVLLLVIVIRGKTPESVRLVAEGLLKHLALLYVPAGVGLMVHLELITQSWAVILLALFVSTLITLVVTLWVLKRFAGQLPHKDS